MEVGGKKLCRREKTNQDINWWCDFNQSALMHRINKQEQGLVYHS